MGERKRGRGEEPSENAGGQEDGSNGIMQDDTDMGTVTAEEQRKQYLAAEQGVQLEVGEEWFVVDHRWLKRFKKYTQIIDQDNEPPPPEEIDQRAIVIVPTLRRGSAATDFDETQDFVHALRKQGDAVPVMRDELCSGRDFELVTQAQWALLVKWYGGGPAIPRKVQQGDRVFVDLYPLQVWVQTGKRGEPRAMLITRTRTMSLFVSDLLENLPEGESGTVDEVRVYQSRFSNDRGVECLAEDRSTLADHNIRHHTVFRLEKRREREASPDGSLTPPVRDATPQRHRGEDRDFAHVFADRPSATGPASPVLSAEAGQEASNFAVGALFSNSSPDRISPGREPRIEPGRGAQGLLNLGNTCFMNSALQCLSNTKLLTGYFISGGWQSELNTTNPLGLHGELATKFAALLSRLWSEPSSFATDPADLKKVIGRFAPQFTGYSQHDSQELLAFLLDGLHEDLNRIQDKPATEIPTGDGSNDVAVAALAWERHLLRNDSAIQDLFAAQYRSKLQCPCGNVSVTFDPYTSVPVQIPQAKQTAITVMFHPADQLVAPMRFTLRLSRTATVSDLKTELERLSHAPAGKTVVAEISNSRICQTFSDSAKVKDLDGETHAYHMPIPPSSEAPMAKAFGVPRFSMGLRGASSGLRSSTRGAGGGDADAEPEPREPLFVKVVQRKPRAYGGYETFGMPSIAVVYGPTLSYRQLRCAMVKAVRRCINPPPSGSLSTLSGLSSPPSRVRTLEKGANQSSMQNLERGTAGGSPPSSGSPPRGSVEAMDCDGVEEPSGGVARSEAALSGEAEGGGEEEIGREFPGLLEDALVLKTASYSGTEISTDEDVGAWTSSASNGGVVDIYLDWNEHGVKEVLNLTESDRCEEHSSASQGAAAAERLSLESCLQHFTTPEVLSENDQWYCGKCEEHVRATKTMQLWSAPQNLVVHLKRFSDEEGGSFFSRDKVDTLVEFPVLGLDLGPFVDSSRVAGARGGGAGGAEGGGGEEGSVGGPLLYDLYAVSNHFGGVGFGHYTAYAKSPSDGTWRLYDDSHVSTCSAESVCTPAAYVLFYSLRT